MNGIFPKEISFTLPEDIDNVQPARNIMET